MRVPLPVQPIGLIFFHELDTHRLSAPLRKKILLLPSFCICTFGIQNIVLLKTRIIFLFSLYTHFKYFFLFFIFIFHFLHFLSLMAIEQHIICILYLLAYLEPKPRIRNDRSNQLSYKSHFEKYLYLWYTKYCSPKKTKIIFLFSLYTHVKIFFLFFIFFTFCL